MDVAPKFFGNFNSTPRPKELAGVADDLPQKVKDYLQLLEIRAEENRGDTKWYDSAAAEVLGVSERTIRRYKKILIAKKLIGTCLLRKKIDGYSGMVRSVQVFRCWRVVIRHRYDIRDTVAWKSDPRPPKPSDTVYRTLIGGEETGWLASGTVHGMDKYGSYVVHPVWKTIIDLAALGVWNADNDEVRGYYTVKQDWFQPRALKVLGYPRDYKFKRLGWSEDQAETYRNDFDTYG